MAPFDRPYTTFYWFAIVTMALSYIISELKRDIVENRDFHTPHAFDAPVRGSRQNIVIPFDMEN